MRLDSPAHARQGHPYRACAGAPSRFGLQIWRIEPAIERRAANSKQLRSFRAAATIAHITNNALTQINTIAHGPPPSDGKTLQRSVINWKNYKTK